MKAWGDAWLRLLSLSCDELAVRAGAVLPCAWAASPLFGCEMWLNEHCFVGRIGLSGWGGMHLCWLPLVAGCELAGAVNLWVLVTCIRLGGAECGCWLWAEGQDAFTVVGFRDAE